MPDWSDSGLILCVKKFSEHDGIVTFFTQNHGKHNALCKGALSKKNRGVFQTGNLVQLTWKARLEEHLGTAKVDLLTSYSSGILDNPDALTVLSALAAMSSLLPERESVPDFFQKTLEQMALLEIDGAFERYARWEVDLLKYLGFGLDFSACAVTGNVENLAYVSPKSGRAVSFLAGQPWKDKLLSLPEFLISDSNTARNNEEIKKALFLTGFFLENYVLKTLDCPIPNARYRVLDRICP